jgi:ABC-type transport system involved in cytochrome c biogenesis permease subunit
VLERILFRLIAVGFVLLTLTALSGVLFSEQVFGRPVRFDHKTGFHAVRLGCSAPCCWAGCASDGVAARPSG